MGASFCYLSRPFGPLTGKLEGHKPPSTVANVKRWTRDYEKWLLNRDLSRLGVKPHTQQRLCLNCGIPKSKHTRITSNTGSADLRVFKNSGLLQFQSGSQTNQGQRPNDFILFDIFKLFVSKRRKLSRNSHGETSRYLCESETLLLRLLDFCEFLSRQNLLNLKSPLSQSLF